MPRSGFLFSAFLALLLALAPGLADARAGAGASMGSRGSRSYSAPPGTSTAPYSALPLQRSLTSPSAPAPGYNSGYGYGAGYNRSPFMSGLMGGLLGAGLGGLLFGGGLFHGITGFGGLLGFLLQVFLLVLLVRWLFRGFLRSPVLAGGGGMLSRFTGDAGTGPRPAGGAAAAQRIQIGPPDYQAFEQLLNAVQGAWSAHDMNSLRRLATPEMTGYFAEQLADQSRRGVRNSVTEVRLDKGDLAEAWSENGRDYATVAMRFSMIDVTRDASGRVIDGDPVNRTRATELWTFVRPRGGSWTLSAIQQAR